MQKNTFNLRLAKSKKAHREFFKGSKGILFCSRCGIHYFKKGWRHTADHTADIDSHNESIKFCLCPACEMITENQYEGRIEVSNVPQKYMDNLTGLIENYGYREWERNPLSRVISIMHESNSLIITTTENQLASRMAKKIQQAFHPAGLSIDYSKEPGDVVRVSIIFDVLPERNFNETSQE